MGFDDFATRWHRIEEANSLPLRARWARLPHGEFAFLRPDEAASLREVGLPNNAPCFTFRDVAEGMPRVDEVYGPHDDQLWRRIGRESVAAFRMLGSDGCGNPLALHIESRDIWLLDHEADFVPFAFVNSDLAAFAESLLLFKRAVAQDSEVDEADVAALHEQLGAIDPRAAERGAFWHGYAEDLPDFI